jgi:hypothetical protein
MKRNKWVILNRHARWWKNSKEVKKWVIEDKNGDYWLINGSEFPEKKSKSSESLKTPSNEEDVSLIRVLSLVFLASILGVSLGIALISFILS